MPTIIKIKCDASEYAQELAKTIALSREAASQVEKITAGGEKGVDISINADVRQAADAVEQIEKLQALGGEEVSVSVDASEVSEAAAQVEKLTESDGTEVNVTVNVKQTGGDLKETRAGIEDVKNSAVTIPSQTIFGKLKDEIKDGWKHLTDFRGGFKKLAASIGAAGGPIGVITAGVLALGKIISWVGDQARQKKQDLAEMHKSNAESIREAAAANEELRQKSDGYMSRLGELASSEKLSNTQKTEALRLIRELKKSYGDLSISIDAATGRITGYSEAMVEKLKRDRANRIAEIDNEISELREQYGVQRDLIRDADRLFSGEKGNEVMMAAAAKGTEITNQINKLAKEKAALLGAGDPEADLLRQFRAERDDLRRNAVLQRRERYGRENDEVYSRLMSEGAFSGAAEVKRGQLEAARKRTEAKQKRVAAGEAAVNNATSEAAKLEAQINLLHLQEELTAAKEKELAVSKQLAAAEQKAADLKGQGLEYAKKTAVAAAETQRGRALTDDEKDSVRRFAELEYGLGHDFSRKPAAADLSIQSDALTRRGGFRSGAVVPDADRWNRLNNELQKKSVSRLDEIAGIVRELSPKKNNDDPGN